MKAIYQVAYTPQAYDDLLSIFNNIVFYLIDSQNMIVTVNRILYGGRDIEQIANDY